MGSGDKHAEEQRMLFIFSPIDSPDAGTCNTNTNNHRML
jgi:hypothetical protein